jgi:hypothetical protein
MLKVEELKVGHRYLFLETHVDGDIPFEAVLEEFAPSRNYGRLLFPDGSYKWMQSEWLQPVEELSKMRKTDE